MDYQARLTEILEKVRKGGVYDVMPEYERQSDYLDTDEAQEVITALFLESVGEDGTRWSYSAPMEMPVDMHREMLHRQIESNQRAYDIRRKWQTNQEEGEMERERYHLSYGDLIKALRDAPAGVEFDTRVKGIGSYRGYYTDIALFTEDEGYSCEDEEYDYDQGFDGYKSWEEKNRHSGDLPKDAHKLADLLESLVGKGFSGWKGGHFVITLENPLWLTTEAGTVDNDAVVGVDKDLNLITKSFES